MDNLDVTVLRALSGWRSAGQRALLATVVRTWGSSPRPEGSIMALCESGAVVGSVSGGCIEDDLIFRFTRAWGSDVDSNHKNGEKGTSSAENEDAARTSGPPIFATYGVTADEAHRFGLPCGGTLELLIEFDPDAAALVELLAALEAGTLMQRSVLLADGAVVQQPAAAPTTLQANSEQVVNTFGPEYRMLIIGAGQMSEYLATMALFSGFAVTVCDPREEYRSSWSVLGATLLSDMPDDVVAAMRPDRRTCVVALTHDPKLDDLALLQALETEAFYVGGIGSRRNNAARRERLKEHFEQTDASLARLRGPIGIYIGSKTPPEIAVSVMAEVLAVKNGITLPRDMEVGLAKQEREQSREN